MKRFENIEKVSVSCQKHLQGSYPPNNFLPVSSRVGKGSSIKYLVLQVHYGKLDHLPAAGDDSGVVLEFTTQPQPKIAGVLLLGTGGLAPPRSTTFFESACEIEDGRKIHPFAFRVHTHALGEERKIKSLLEEWSQVKRWITT